MTDELQASGVRPRPRKRAARMTRSAATMTAGWPPRPTAARVGIGSMGDVHYCDGCGQKRRACRCQK